MSNSHFQIKSKVFLLLLGSQLTVMASCQSDSASNSKIGSIQQTDKSFIKNQHDKKQDSSCCQSNIPDRFAVPSKKMKPESLKLKE